MHYKKTSNIRKVENENFIWYDYEIIIADDAGICIDFLNGKPIRRI